MADAIHMHNLVKAVHQNGGRKLAPRRACAMRTFDVTSYKSASDKLASTIQTQLQSLTEGLKSLSSLPTSRTVSTAPVSNLSSLSASSEKSGAGQAHKHSSPFSRSNRIILFNLPEKSLVETKSAIDEISEFLIGKTVNICNAVRLGQRKSSDSDSAFTRPQPSPHHSRERLG